MSHYQDLYRKLSTSAVSFVPPKGGPETEIIIVGEQPGRTEVGMREPFVGTSGRLLSNCLHAAGIPVASCYKTNVLKDFDLPLSMEKPDADWQKKSYCKQPVNRFQSPQWTDRASEYIQLLKEEVDAHPSKLIIAVGNVALSALTGRWGISKWRGSILPCNFNAEKWVIPTIHPASVLRGSSVDRHLIIADLVKARNFRDSNYHLTPRKLLTAPSWPQVCQFLTDLEEAGRVGHQISWDIECKYLEMNCLSLCSNPFEAMSIPLVYERGPFWSPPQEADLIRRIGKILENPMLRKVGQNLAFDTHFMLRRYGMRAKRLDDTMIAHHILLPQLNKGLDVIASLWTDIPYYKDEGKEWFKKGGRYEQLWEYNALDSIVCSEAFPKMMDDLLSSGNLQTYERQLSVLEPCVYMQEVGIAVDIDGLRLERESMRAEAQNKRKRLEQIAPGLNLNSPMQLKAYFYDHLGCPPYKNKAGKVSCDKDALKRIARNPTSPGKEPAQLILGAKGLEKVVSTYLEDVKFDEDNRVRCSYNPAGTMFSRLSSSKSIFGTGMNMQNWPHDAQKHLVADPNCVVYGLDLSQAENRIVAYVGQVEVMIRAFETNQDVHKLTAGLIFNKKPEDISSEPGSSDLGSGDKSERDWGKRANHGLNYDLGYKNFALYYDMPERESKRIVEGYHSAYPEIRKNFHGHVKTSLRKDRTVTNLWGRRTTFMGDVDDDMYKAAYSCIPQGTVGDIMIERGMGLVYYDPHFREVQLLRQVHDSIDIQIPLALPWELHAQLLWQLKHSLEPTLTTHYGRQFSIPVDITMGFSLHKETGYELKAKSFPSTQELLAVELEKAYNTLEERRGNRTNP